MSQNPEVKLARNTELAFTEAHLTDLKPESSAIFYVLPGDCRAASHGSFFYRATRMHSADYAVARCLSVCLSVHLSHAGIESKRLYISSKFFHRRVAHHSSFPVPNVMSIFRRGPFHESVECKGSMKK